MRITKFDYPVSNDGSILDNFVKELNNLPLWYKAYTHYRVALSMKWQIIKYSVKNFFNEALSESQSVSDNEQEKRSCGTCKHKDGFRCNHPDNCDGDYENWEQL